MAQNVDIPQPLNVQDTSKIINRLKRARGQLDAVIQAIENDASCDQIVTQLSAAHSAVRKAAFLVVAGAMRDCAINPSHTHSSEEFAHLEKLFMSLS